MQDSKENIIALLISPGEKIKNTVTRYKLGLSLLPKETYIVRCLTKGQLIQGLLNRWTSQLDLVSSTGGLERVVSVQTST